MSISRREALSGAVTLGVAAGVAACGDGEARTTGSDAAAEPSSATPPSAPEPSPSTTATDKPTQTASGLVAASDVPVGGGVIIGEEEIVVTQPSEGDFKAFSALCTHQGCLLARVEDEEIQCDCHGSRFSATDGSPTGGPATAPLGAVEITVKGGQVQRA